MPYKHLPTNVDIFVILWSLCNCPPMSLALWHLLAARLVMMMKTLPITKLCYVVLTFQVSPHAAFGCNMYWEERGNKASLNQLSLMHAPSLWLTDVPSQEGRPKVVEMLCDFIATIFRWSSAQKIVFENEVAVRGILASLQSLLAGDMLKKV